MLCPNCNTEVGGLVDLELLLRKCNVYGFDSNCEFKKTEVMRNQLANKILSHFGTPKEKLVELDEKSLHDFWFEHTGGYPMKDWVAVFIKGICSKFGQPKPSNPHKCNCKRHPD